MRLALALVVALTVAPARTPLVLTQPTGIELEPAGTLLIVENNPGRILRLDPRTGRVTTLEDGLSQPYAIVRTRSGIFFSTYTAGGGTIRRLGGARGQTRVRPGSDPGEVVARNSSGYGPLAAAPDGTIYYANGVGVYRLRGGSMAPRLHVSNPHGIAVARDGALLVSDTGDDRVLRIAHGHATPFARLPSPRGIDVGPDGSVYVVDPVDGRIAHLSPSGRRLGWVGKRLPGDPYDLQVAPNGDVLVLESGAAGDIVRIGTDGTMRLLTRR